MLSQVKSKLQYTFRYSRELTVTRSSMCSVCKVRFYYPDERSASSGNSSFCCIEHSDEFFDKYYKAVESFMKESEEVREYYRELGERTNLGSAEDLYLADHPLS